MGRTARSGTFSRHSGHGADLAGACARWGIPYVLNRAIPGGLAPAASCGTPQETIARSRPCTTDMPSALRPGRRSRLPQAGQDGGNRKPGSSRFCAVRVPGRPCAPAFCPLRPCVDQPQRHPFAGRASPPGAEGPLRLAYLGGKSRHRGYFFLARALRGLQATILTALHQRGKSHPPRLFPTRPFFSVFRTLDRTIFQPERSGQCLSRHQAGHYARMPNALGRGLLHGHRYGLLA